MNNKSIILSLLLLLLCAMPLRTEKLLPVVPMPRDIHQTETNHTRDYSAVELNNRGLDHPYTTTLFEEIAQMCTAKGTDTLVITLQQERPRSSGLKKALARYRFENYVDKLGEEGYVLVWKQHNATIISCSARGAMYGMQTLKQLLRAGYSGDVEIADHPSFARRVFFDDVSRGAVSTVEYIKSQIRQLAELKYNGLTFYIEHVVQPTSRPDFCPVNGKYTMEDIREICRYAATYGMEVIGSFQSFGHFDNILALDHYKHLGDTPSMIAPLNPEAQKFLKDVIEELCDNFSSEYFNINCDETWDLANGKSKEYVARVGADRFYADHVKFLYDIIKQKGKKTMVWGDIIMKYPHLIDLLPKDLIYLPWEYGRLNSFEPWLKPFVDKRANFWICPGVLNSNRLIPDMEMARGNMLFIEEALANKAQGVILTTWDDTSFHTFYHLWYGVFLGAESIWNPHNGETKESLDQRFSLLRLGDKTMAFTKAYDVLHQLKEIGLTYNMNDRMFYDRFTPEPGESITVNMKEVEAADRVISRAEEIMAEAQPTIHHTDVEALSYSIGQYRFVVDSRKTVAMVAKEYQEAQALSLLKPAEARGRFISLLDSIRPLAVQIEQLRASFAKFWLIENQSYTLDKGLAAYELKRQQTHQVEQSLMAAVDSIDRSAKVTAPLAAGLDIRNVNSNYFGYWLSCGGFKNGAMDKDYLKEMGGELNVNPTPGERFEVEGSGYKWTRTTSDNGFIVDMNTIYHSENNALGYATVVINSEREQTVTALLGTTGQASVILNADLIFTTGKENEFTADKYTVPLKLKNGQNRLILKSLQLVTQWCFSFRLDNVEVNANKQRYYVK